MITYFDCIWEPSIGKWTQPSCRSLGASYLICNFFHSDGFRCFFSFLKARCRESKTNTNMSRKPERPPVSSVSRKPGYLYRTCIKTPISDPEIPIFPGCCRVSSSHCWHPTERTNVGKITKFFSGYHQDDKSPKITNWFLCYLQHLINSNPLWVQTLHARLPWKKTS